MIKTPQKLPDVTDAGFHNPTIEVNWFYSDFVLQSITPTNSSQSDTHHNNIYKEQGKD